MGRINKDDTFLSKKRNMKIIFSFKLVCHAWKAKNQKAKVTIQAKVGNLSFSFPFFNQFVSLFW